jgi:hypothetical protein
MAGQNEQECFCLEPNYLPAKHLGKQQRYIGLAMPFQSYLANTSGRNELFGIKNRPIRPAVFSTNQRLSLGPCIIPCGKLFAVAM